MFQTIAAVVAALFGLGASLGGAPNTGQTNPDLANTQKIGIGCYSPSPSETITLTWPDNFVALTDKRVTLNPHVWGNKPLYFNTRDDCRKILLTNSDGDLPESDPVSRTYIKVRDSVRISSCKTDELAGPYGVGECPGSVSLNLTTEQMRHRGFCEDNAYQELRKVAEVNMNGEIKEIFWTGYSHNVACNFDPNNPNCPWKTAPQNMNLREFVYVLKSREAFGGPNDLRAGCKVRFDAGSTNKDACSHYFDVYMAEDLYDKTQNGVSSDDPDYKNYQFVKQAVENCHENSTFAPIVDVPGIRIPPQFIELPFIAQDFFTPQSGKIVPGDSVRLAAYQQFILNTGNINPFKTSLIEITGPTVIQIVECALTDPAATCYVAIGSLTVSGNNQTTTYTVYTRTDSPESFYLRDISAGDTLVYQYTATQDTPPTRNEHDPSLQLSQLRFSSNNEWTWATPLCKPALYFYPEQPTQLNVTLQLDGKLTESDPLYDPITGWDIMAYPNGLLKPTTNNPSTTLRVNPQRTTTTYPYLYYEADINDVDLPKEGWVIEKSNIKDQISKIMMTIGFNEKETADFLAYWLPKLREKPYYFVSLLPEEVINQKEQLIIQPFDSVYTEQRRSAQGQPTTIIRVRFVFEGLDQPVSVKEPAHVPRYTRTGFVVTDWGGTIVGKSCQDVTMQ